MAFVNKCGHLYSTFMNNTIHVSTSLLCLTIALSFATTSVFASDDAVIAVLSSNSSPYMQAYSGFQQSFGQNVPLYVLSQEEPRISSRTRIIVAIGGKAALYSYPQDVVLIYCMAPGTKVKPYEHRGSLIKIHTSPAVSLTLSKFKKLQPSLKTIAVLWSGDSIQDYFEQKSEIEKKLGIEMLSFRIRNPDDLPDHLRSLKGRVNAIWLPPDAVMVTPKNFTTIKEFTLANGIPFYVPTDALVQQGALASVNSSYEEIGALAGKLARQALTTESLPDRLFPEKLHISLNLTTAKACNLTYAPEDLKQIEKIVP